MAALSGIEPMLVSLFVLAAAPAAAAANSATPAAQLPTAKVECRMVKEAGSRIATRICRLDKEWELLSKDAQDDWRNSRNSREVGLNPAG